MVFFVVIHNLTTRREAISEAVSRTRTIASGRSQRAWEVEQRLSLDAVEGVNKKPSSQREISKT